MPTDVRAEDGTRDTYQLAFGNIDNDGSKTIDLTGSWSSTATWDWKNPI